MLALTMSEIENTLYLPDEPIQTGDEDEFRHTNYAETLYKIIKETDTPWHIGLFGPWGSGKTSIIKILENRINGDSSVVLVEFDAWKHAEESIRTELLLELDTKLGKAINNDESPIIGEEDITEDLYDVTVGESKRSVDAGDLESEWEGIKKFIQNERWLLVITLAIIGIVLAISHFVNPTSGATVGIAILVPLLVFMAKQLSDVTSTIQRKFLYPRREWSGAFERIFSDMISKVDKEKIVISVDNLDRCDPKTTYDVLISLKSFMDKKKCIYIVPCDADALRSQVQKMNEGVFPEKDNRDEEFLRKFFESRISINNLLTDDVDDYLKSLNNRLIQPYDPDVLDVLTSAHIENPRHIKEAINRMTTLRILAEEMESSKSERSINPNQVTGNLPFLAKVSILEAEFPEFYKRVNSDPDLLREANEFVKGERDEADIDSSIEEFLVSDGGRQEPRLTSFLGSTLPFDADQYEPFFNLGEPDYASVLEDSAGFERAIRSGQIDQAREIVQAALKEDVDETIFVGAFRMFLNRYQRQSRIQPFTSAIRVLLEIYEEFNDSIKIELATVLHRYSTRPMGSKALRDQNFEKLFLLLGHLDQSERENILDIFINTFGDSDSFSESRFQVLLSNRDLVPDNTESGIIRALTRLSDDDLQLPLELIHQSGESDMVSSELRQRAAAMPQTSENQNEIVDTEFYGWFDKFASPDDRGQFIEQLVSLLENYDGNQQRDILLSFNREVTSVDSNITAETADRMFRTLRDSVSNWNLQEPEFIRPVFKFHQSFTSDIRSESLDWVNELIRQWQPDQIRETINYSQKYGCPIFQHDGITQFVLNQIPSNVNDRDYLQDTLVGLIGEEQEEELNQKVIQLMQSGSNNQAALMAGVDLFLGDPEMFRQSAREIALAAREATQQNANHSNVTRYIRAETTAFQYLEDEHKEEYIIELIDSIKTGNHHHFANFREIWKNLEDIPKDTKKTVERSLAVRIEEQLDGNTDPQRIRPLVEVWLSEADHASEDRAGELVDSISQGLLTDQYNISQKEELISILSKFDSYYQRDEQILRRVANLLDDHEGRESIQEQSRLILDVAHLDNVDDDLAEKIESHLD